MITNQFLRMAVRILTVTILWHVTDLPTVKAALPPEQGDTAPNFTLKTLDGKSVALHQLTARSRVVIVVLRGYPGYQCPICDRQVQDLIQHAAPLKERGAQMVFVYPGPAKQLENHAREFLENKNWPSEFLFVVDPDFTFTTAYGLRWIAPNETAYPSTFIISRDAKVQFAHVSKEHGGRVYAKELIKQL